MYLQKLEIQGFKSFAQRTTLVFNRQMTAVVGPNGSGKSNIADAVRWVLGEQSLKLLRGKRAEDVIFAGSDQKGRLGMAEVSLFLNNEDGETKVEYSEIVVTRRVFRDGQSEYLINNQAVRLGDVNLLLARANFGQKTYSVIGQGMVDSILMSTPAERKEFFEEATGVKQYQLKREQAIGKLVSTYENLEQAGVVIQEIEPRLKTLTRQVKRLEERERLEAEVRNLQKLYFGFRYHSLESRRRELANVSMGLLANLAEQRRLVSDLQTQVKTLDQADATLARRRTLEEQQTSLRTRLNTLYKEQAVAQAEEELGYVKRGEGEVAMLKQRLAELTAEVRRLESRQTELEHEIIDTIRRFEVKSKEQARLLSEFDKQQGADGTGWLERELVAVADDQAEARRQLVSVKTVTEAHAIANMLGSLGERLLALIKRLKQGGSMATSGMQQMLSERDGVVKEVADLQARLAAAERELGSVKSALALVREQVAKVEHSLAKVHSASTVPHSNLGDIAKKVIKIETDLKTAEQDLRNLQTTADSRSAELLALQRQLQSAGEIERRLEHEVHEIELELARLETKLEDMDREMAQEMTLELVHEIKSVTTTQAIDEGATALELQKLKHQWELTGGIEPEVVGEYQQTKTRFDFLTTQVADLQAAAASLESIIHDLDATIHQKFLTSFKAINEKFGAYFKTLFLGGKAQLILQKEEEVDETAEVTEVVGPEGEVHKPTARERFLKQEKVRSALFAGVEIQATPPGKKLSTMTALSGGEKALTSIALICSIISTHPSPFVVLDEVDAALDEANSERFAAILDSLVTQTQFITITHNRATMKQASLLYGVTMGDDGVSKLLSVKLEEAENTVKS